MNRSHLYLRYVPGILLACCALCAHAEDRGVFIGTARYKGEKRGSLLTTRFDANDMHNTLIGQGVLGKNSTDLLVGINRRQQILNTIKKRATGMGPKDTLYIYNSSHGTEDGKILAYDKGIAGKDIAAMLEGSRCGKVIIINDSCHSAAFKVEIDGKDVAHINACSKENVSWTTSARLDGMGHANSALTKWLIEGLKQGAADKDGNGEVSVTELTDWAGKAVAKNEDNDVSLDSYNNPPSRQNPNCTGGSLTVSKAGPGKPFLDQCLVPDVLKVEAADAVALLKTDGLKARQFPADIGKGRHFSADWAGTVVRQSPRSGVRVRPGVEVELVIASKDVRIVPDIRGMDPDAAEERIEARDLEADPPQPQIPFLLLPVVVYTLPGARTPLVKGSHVSYELG